MKMTKFYINLLNFNNYKLAGAGYFFKRIISNVNFDENKWNNVESIIILSNNNVDPIQLFDFKSSAKIKVVKLPLAGNFLVRIFYEQIFLPFFLIGNKGIFYSPTPAVPLLLKWLNEKLIIIPTIHDMIPFHMKEKYPFIRRLYVKFISKKAAHVANKIVTVSCFSKNDIVDIANVAASKIEVIYNFIPNVVFNDLKIESNYFLTICTVEPGKNLENMIKGFSLFLKNNAEKQNYLYKIIGQLGWNYNSILALVSKLNLEKNIEFVGYVDDELKNTYIKQCIGLIYLSKYEGFGIPPLEAMYYNKVSIVSNTSSLPEVVGNAGIIQDPDNIELLASNLGLLLNGANEYKTNISTQLVKFDPDIQIEKFQQLILSNIS